MGTEAQSPKQHDFVKRNFVYIVIFSILCMAGVEKKAVLIASIAVFLFAVVFSSNEERFCWSLFLIPNIRIYDNLGSSSIVNILMCSPFLFYIAKEVSTRRTRVDAAPVFMAFCMFMIEYLHMISLRVSIYPLLGWILAFLWCYYVTVDENINIRKEDITYALALGIICSAIIYMVNNTWLISDVMDKITRGYRFEAYANDPNYYSLYICLSLAGLVIKKHLKIIDYVLIVVLMGIEFLTASKMGFLLMALLILYLVVGGGDDLNKYVRSVLIIAFGCCAIYILRDYVVQFLENLFERSGGKKMNMSSFTTGRSDIFLDYFKMLGEDSFLLLFGRGFYYLAYTWRVISHIAHNTYLDFLLSWGISGCVVFFFIITHWFKQHKKSLHAKKYTFASKVPFFVLALTFFALSCFSAGMFFFVIAFCLLQLEPVTDVTSIEQERNEDKY